tara:strand:- start:2130 stop:2318 length:189 start_codon:yes stop_codon:yes gene_type:complete
MTSFIDALEMGKVKDYSRIVELDLYLTEKIIKSRGSGYKPECGDGDQEIRNELKDLRKKWMI